MADRNYWVLCDDNCKFPAMTKEQTLAAIAQAVKNGSVSDVDTGFVTTIKTISGAPLKFFVGTQSEYDALPAAQKTNLFAIISNDTTKEGILNRLDILDESVELIWGQNEAMKTQQRRQLERIVALENEKTLIYNTPLTITLDNALGVTTTNLGTLLNKHLRIAVSHDNATYYGDVMFPYHGKTANVIYTRDITVVARIDAVNGNAALGSTLTVGVLSGANKTTDATTATLEKVWIIED